MSDPTVEPRPVRTAVSATTTAAVIIAIVAVVLGFLILRDLDGGNSTVDPGTGPVATDPVDTAAVQTTTTLPTKTTTTLLTTGFEVQVANASGVGGSAGKLTDQLTGRGYVMVEPTNAADGTPIQATTVVYAVAGFEAGAESVAKVLGGKDVLPMPEVIPTDSGDLGSANVLVMLGTDQAGKRLPKKSG